MKLSLFVSSLQGTLSLQTVPFGGTKQANRPLPCFIEGMQIWVIVTQNHSLEVNLDTKA